MKKIIYQFMILIFVSISSFGQMTGDGTWGTPYTGTMTTGSFTISGSKYFNQIDVSGGTLTINPGATLLAKTPTTYITVSSTGGLNAVGSVGSIIAFSADNNGDGVAGPGDPGKNVTFENSTGQ